MNTPFERTILSPRIDSLLLQAKKSGLVTGGGKPPPPRLTPGKKRPRLEPQQQRLVDKVMSLCDATRDPIRVPQFVHTVSCMADATFRLLLCLLLYHEKIGKKLPLATPALYKVVTHLQSPSCNPDHFTAAMEKVRRTGKSLSDSGVAQIFWQAIRNPEPVPSADRALLQQLQEDDPDRKWSRGTGMRPSFKAKRDGVHHRQGS